MMKKSPEVKNMEEKSRKRQEKRMEMEEGVEGKRSFNHGHGYIQYGKFTRLAKIHADILCNAVVHLFVEFMHIFCYEPCVWKLI